MALGPASSAALGQLIGKVGKAAITPPAFQIDNRSSSSSNASVAVSPQISVVTGGGSNTGNPNASASGSPYADSSGAFMQPSSPSGYTASAYAPSGGYAAEQEASGGLLSGINPLWIVGAIGAVWFVLTGKKKRKAA